MTDQEDEPQPEQVHDVEPGVFGNDPFINELVREAEQDNIRKEQGTKVALFVSLSHAHRLKQASEHGLQGARWEQFGHQISGFKKIPSCTI